MSNTSSFRDKWEKVRRLVGVFVDTQPKDFPIDVSISTRLAVSPPKQLPKKRGYYDYYGCGIYKGLDRRATYAGMSPEQRWLYISWLAGDKVTPTQQFLMARYYALCAELCGGRVDEAVTALAKLSKNYFVTHKCHQAIAIACAATRRYAELNRCVPMQMHDAAFKVALSVLHAQGHDLSGGMLLALADANGAWGTQPNGTPEQAVQAAEKMLRAWNEREGKTLLAAIADDRLYPLYLTEELAFLARHYGLKLKDVTVTPQSMMAEFVRAFGIVARRHCVEILNATDAQPFLDEIQRVMDDYLLMKGVYRMKPAEEAELERKLNRVAGIVGVRIVNRYPDGWLQYGYHLSANPQAAIARDHPIKKPTSPQPRESPQPLKYDHAGYNKLNPEQRWWYLDWLAGEDVKPLGCFYAVRLKGLLAVPNAFSNDEVVECVEKIFGQTDNDEVRRAAGYVLMQYYSKRRDGEKATWLFERMKPTSANGLEMLRLLAQAGGRLTGAGVLWAARAARYQHTPPTREHFDEIAAIAQRLLDAYEAQHGSLLDRIITRSRGSYWIDYDVAGVLRDMAKQAQKEFRDSRPKLTRSDRMSAAEKAQEQKELAAFRTDETTEAKVLRVYETLTKSANGGEQRLLSLYLQCGASALESGDRVKAIAYLRRATELDGTGAARRLLEKALAQDK